MITLKEWNSFDKETRTEILRTLRMSQQLAPEPYHHNFDYDSTGNKMKLMLSCCNKQKDGTINIVHSIMPKYTTEEKKPKVSAKAVKAQAYIDAINRSFESACNVLPEVLQRYGGKTKSMDVNTEMGWNCKIEGFHINKNRVIIDIYWQGDDVDGYEACNLDDVKRGTHVIPSDSYFDGYRTRVNHSDLRITRDMAYNAIKLLIPEIK